MEQRKCSKMNELRSLGARRSESTGHATPRGRWAGRRIQQQLRSATHPYHSNSSNDKAAPLATRSAGSAHEQQAGTVAQPAGERERGRSPSRDLLVNPNPNHGYTGKEINGKTNQVSLPLKSDSNRQPSRFD